MPSPTTTPLAVEVPVPEGEIPRLRDISPHQWRSGIAAWLGWTFDGLDMHLYTLVAMPFVAHLLGVFDTTNTAVGRYASIIQAGFLLGWAVGGGFFGLIGDRIGRARALSLTVLTYAAFTGLSFFAQEWWHLFICRFVAALGIGGEWAVGASLLSETWPRPWRPWIAAVLQSGVNVGVLCAALVGIAMAALEPRFVFLVGILPAFAVFWIRRAVPEPEEWQEAKATASQHKHGIPELFRGETRKVTVWVMAVCAISLTAHWAFMFWYQAHLRDLPDVKVMSPTDRNDLVARALFVIMIGSITGNFFCGWLARKIGYRTAITITFVAYFCALLGAYSTPRDYHTMMYWFAAIGFCQGVFALFTMYLPPLFPTLLRTTGAGFCYNIGRIAAACGTVFFGLFSTVGDYRWTLFNAAFLFIPAAAVSFFLPHVKD